MCQKGYCKDRGFPSVAIETPSVRVWQLMTVHGVVNEWDAF
jgi:hypothetical protein